MSNIIRLLGDLGRSPGIFVAHREEYAAAITASELNAQQQLAFTNRDSRALNDLVGVRGTFRCLIATPE